MNWRIGLTLCLLLAAIASGWSVWRMSHRAEDGLLHARPDYVLRDYEITSLDKQGKESFTLHGPMLQRDPADKTLTLATPRFQVPDRQGRYWDVQAQRGFVPAGGEQLELTGDVIATSPANAPPPTRIATESLVLVLGEHLARTGAEVTITQPGLTMRGVGMQANLDRQHVSLLSQVRAHYAPQQ